MSNMVVSTNIMALNAHRSLKGVGNMQSKASQRLSSGYKINSAADDAAGLAISEKMRAQIRGLDMASKNAQDAISLIQTAEGGMQEIDNMLQRIRELTVQVSSDTNEHNKLGTGDRQKMQDEVDQLVAEIDSMANRVEFNKKKVIDGTYASTSSSSASIQRLREAVTEATQAVTSATAAKDAAGNAYKDFTTATTGGFAKALIAFYGDTAGATALTDGGYATGVLTPAIVAAGAEDAAAGEGILGLLYSKLGALGDASAAFDSLSGVAFETATDDASKAFVNLLKSNGLSDLASIQALAVATAVDPFDSGTAPTIAEVLSFDFDDAFGGSSAASSINILRQIANYKDTTGGVLSDDINAVIDAAKTAVEAYDNVNKFMEKGGAFDEGKKAFDTALKAESDLRANFYTKENDESIAKAQESIAKSRLAAAEAMQGAPSGSKEGLYFQVGANSNQGLQMTINSVKSDVLGIGDGKGNTYINFLKDTGADITKTLDVLDTALSYVTTERSKLGAAQNRLEYTIKSLDISSENLSASESRIRDTDMAKEMMQFTKGNVLQQAATSMLAQANQAPQMILKLLG